MTAATEKIMAQSPRLPVNLPSFTHSTCPAGTPTKRGLLKGSLRAQVTDSRLIAQQEASP